MRILIVGAGIAGMTLAALLDRRGERPTVIDRAPSSSHAGYMLGLYALGHRVLHGLGLWERFAASSVECTRYAAYDDGAELISEWSLGPIAGRYGPLLCCTRPQLVEVLQSGLGAVQVCYEQSVRAIDASATDAACVTFADGAVESFDLVVGADGIGSSVRSLVFGEQSCYDSHWGGWVWFAPAGECPAETFVEYWGAGRFLGVYPTGRGVGVFAGAPIEEGFGSSEGRGARLRARFAGLGSEVDRLMASIPGDEAEMFFWRLSDVRSKAWVHNRVVLLGDAAAGFLPTAGIGASMAMESAAVLADELSRTNARFLDNALALYVKRRKHRVEAIQEDSRRLAKLMFVQSAPVAAARNYVSKFMTFEMAMGAIIKAFDEPI